MALRDRTTAAKIRKAVREYERLGRDEFLTKFEYGKARDYFLVQAGREYDSKAIFGVACGMEHGEFSGGEQTVERALHDHGFPVIHARTHWYEDELVLLLHWYLRYRFRQPFESDDIEVETLARTLEDLATLRRRVGTMRWRKPVDVAAELSRFQSIDERGGDRDSEERSPHTDVWERYVHHEDERQRRVEETLATLEVMRRDARQASTWRKLKGEHVEERRFKYGAHSSAAREAPPASSLAPEDLEDEYQGPGETKPRRRGKPVEDDPEKHERAGRVHARIRHALAMLLSDHGFVVRNPSKQARRQKIDYDLLARRGALRLLVESKSMPTTGAKAEAGRLRLGLGQVLWYRQRFSAACGARPVAVLLLERQPSNHEAWLAVCRDVEVVLTWPERFSSIIEQSESIGARGRARQLEPA